MLPPCHNYHKRYISAKQFCSCHSNSMIHSLVRVNECFFLKTTSELINCSENFIFKNEAAVIIYSLLIQITPLKLYTVYLDSVLGVQI